MGKGHLESGLYLIKIIFPSTWTTFARGSVGIAGLESRTAFAIVMTPGFWLPRPAMATALLLAY